MTDNARSYSATADAMTRLVEIMAKLRDKDAGCAWDVAQTFSTIAPYTIEEAYEVADAIQRDDMDELKEELGDLLFQVVFHSQMAREVGAFEITDVVEAINSKMVRRHPHVFGQEDARTADQQVAAWEVIKAQERAGKGTAEEPSSALDGVALALPSLLRAEKLQKRAARVGFDWTEAAPIFEKLTEETDEVREAIETGDHDKIEDELGDLLFVAANLSRRLNVDPEQALRRANAKFERRFRAMEALALDDGNEFSTLDIDAQEALWQRVKKHERTSQD
jgi:nucleoside triphosphate diphosphatase